MAKRLKLSPEEQHANLVGWFGQIKCRHKDALCKRAVRIILAASVMRVFKPKTKDDLGPVLEAVPIDDLLGIRNESEFRDWFNKHLKKVEMAVSIKNRGNKKIGDDYTWGHCTKVLALYLREIVLSSRYFNDRETERMQHLLYVPIDGININKLKELGYSLPFNLIKEIDTQEKFYDVQDILGKAAIEAGVPRIWFDDNWGDR